MVFARASGVLAHPTSFPGPHGIGDLGESAFRFVDWLAVAGQRIWQVMPLGPTGYGDSPYASLSAFAGNPLLVSLPWLAGDGLLSDDDLTQIPPLPDFEVDYGRVIDVKTRMLRVAFDNFRRGAAANQRPGFEAFCQEQACWLDDFALFMALKAHHGSQGWFTWPQEIRLRQPDAIARWTKELKDDVRFHKFIQYQFRRQWSELKRYANERDIRIIGDIPIFVAYDSADVWAHGELFQLDDEGRPLAVSGVPPDLFTEHGQLWGNPLFDWAENRRTGFAWWIDRIRATLSLIDIIRIDHFRGFAASWSVPASAPTAAFGHWQRGPGRKIFDAIRNALGDVPIIVEDLGLITDDVNQLREELGFPGMNVLQFAFDRDPANRYLPHNYVRNSVVYTGTHDNQTTTGWFLSLDDADRQQVQRYLGHDGSDIAWDMLRLALQSVAQTSVIPLQDVMRLGDEARMNAPGRATGNWTWRFLPHQLHHGLAAGLGDLTDAYGRRARAPKISTPDPYDYTAQGTAHPLTAEDGE
jgi:4-alpha-glucanotransferase